MITSATYLADAIQGELPDDLREHKSESAIRAAGRLRTEGRDYALQEGDVCHFLIGKG